jgi:dTDP-4-dehydrorhamnose 3,5-epimerase
MRFIATPLQGAYVIEPERLEDERGFFARSWCHEAFAARGLNSSLAQCNISFNAKRGTLRGLHYQAAPYEEAKLVRCTRGRAWDVMVDLRRGSPTRACWLAVEISAENRRMVYLPEGFAHGFQALADDTELFYQMSAPYRAEAVRGVRWDDPTLRISWPVADPIVSPKDRSLPSLAEAGLVDRAAWRLGAYLEVA